MSSVLEGVSQWLPRLNALVVGPGLGREASQMTNVKHLLQRARERQMDMVIDAVSNTGYSGTSLCSVTSQDTIGASYYVHVQRWPFFRGGH